jgi:hypothetical protein
MKLNDRELATVLAALRYWQTDLPIERDYPRGAAPRFPGRLDRLEVTKATISGKMKIHEIDFLSETEIGQLCERLNCGEDDPSPGSAFCEHCGDQMTDDTDTCSINEILHWQGQLYNTVPYKPNPTQGRCHDCNIAAGGKHHPGCDMERCPVCAGQLISCEHGAEESEDK